MPKSPDGRTPSFIHPPFNKSVAGAYPTPFISDVVVIVAKEINSPSYKVEPYGTPHPDSARFPNHQLALIQPSEDGLKAKWVYVASRTDQDFYNFALRYKADDTTSPMYIRQYVLPREGYEPVAVDTPDSADEDAILVHEEVLGAADEPLAGLYIKVLRIFEVLPGPYIPFTRYDDNLGPIQGRRRTVRNTGQQASLTSTTKTTYEGRDGSSVVLWEIEESWTDGSDPAFPIGTADTYENERGAVQTTTQVVVATGSEVGSLDVSGGIATHIEYQPLEGYSPFLLKKITETWAIPAVPLPSEEVNEDGTTTVRTQTMELRTAITEGETVAGGFWTKTYSKAITATISWKIVEVRPVPGNPVLTTEVDRDGTVISVAKTLKEVSTISDGESISGGVWTIVIREGVSELVGREVIRSRSIAT